MKKYFRNLAKAVKYLMSKGYNLDLNQYKNAIVRSKISVDAVYKFEDNDSDNAPAVIYAITINDNLKGIFRDSSDTYYTEESAAAIKKITDSIQAA